MEYINGLAVGDDACFLCRYRDLAGQDPQNYILWRGRKCFALLNRFPYTGGHSMVAPFDHVGDLAELDAAAMAEMMAMLRDLQQALGRAVHAQGFNIGINIGRCAGAGLPGHLHAHVVPRWSGDTNFMTVFGGVRVIPQSLDQVYAAVRAAAAELGLPKLPGQ